MFGLNQLKINWKLRMLIGMALLALAVFGWVSFSTLRIVEINGPLYKQIRMTADITADVAPPALNLQGTRLAVYRALAESDPVKRAAVIEQIRSLKKAYDEMYAENSRDVPDGAVKRAMQGTSHEAALEYFARLEQTMIPLLEKGDLRKAEDFRKEVLVPLAKRHDDAIKELMKLEEDQTAQYEKDASETVTSRTWILIMVGIGACALTMLAGYLIGQSISVPLQKMSAMLKDISEGEGDLTKTLEASGRDELSEVAQYFNKFVEKLRGLIGSIAENAEQLAGASEEMSATSHQITANSEETSAQARVVSEASEHVNRNLQTVATGAEEMTSTINEIAKNTAEAAKVASQAVETAEATNETVGKLGGSSAEIGKVIDVITSIAQQTNLLALNATIEAARAGEAGKGFAVVANEVKELAKQTAKATEEISTKIKVIQENTNGAVDAIGSIRGVIDKISHISSVIATAVEEQSATTNEMSRNVAEAAKGAGEISGNIAGVAEAAQSTSNSVSEAQKATEHLAEMSNQLSRLVGQFKTQDGQRMSGGAHGKAMAAGA